MNQQRSILLVDDNRQNLNILKLMLEKMSYRVEISSNGLEALFQLSAEPFDLVLLDINLPDISGFDVLEQVRETYSITELPVIMLTASTKNQHVVDALALGANDYITKPFDFAVIQSRILTQLTLKSAKEALQLSEERYALASKATKDGLWDRFLDQTSVYVSPNWCSIVGIPFTEKGISIDDYRDLIHPGDLDVYLARIKELISGKLDRIEIEHRMRYIDDSYRWVITTAVCVQNRSGKKIRLLGSVRDITENKLYSTFDHLPNTILIQDRIDQILKQIKSGRTAQASLIFIDLDNFRHINQVYGILTGDHILHQTVERLNSLISGNETLAHAGRDEFIILMEDFEDIQDIHRRIRSIQENLKLPFKAGNDEVEISASSGIVLIDEKYDSAKKIIQDAESAMNIAKKDILQHYHFFKDEFYREIASRLESERRLRKALRNNELEMYYQPQISVQDNTLIGFEALLRWNDPERGIILPDEIIPLAEETDLIIEIGEWTLSECCRQIRRWMNHGFIPCRIAVNLSPLHFNHKDMLSNLAGIIKKYEINAQLLELEITETKVMENPEKNIRIMKELKSLGLSFSIDDFGTGYSSLSMLRRFPLTTLKIDKTFVKDIHNNEDALSIVSAIIAMAQSMKFSTIAEGVETDQQLSLLRSVGCENYQGFLKSRAVNAREASLFLGKYETVG